MTALRRVCYQLHLYDEPGGTSFNLRNAYAIARRAIEIEGKGAGIGGIKPAIYAECDCCGLRVYTVDQGNDQENVAILARSGMYPRESAVQAGAWICSRCASTIPIQSTEDRHVRP